MGERHRLCRRRRLVEQRSVGDIEPGQVRDDRLKIEQRLKSPLADLRLIGRVSRVPCRILQNVALDRRRNLAAMACHFVAYHLPSPNARYCDQSGRTSICGEPTPCIAVVSQA